METETDAISELSGDEQVEAIAAMIPDGPEIEEEAGGPETVTAEGPETEEVETVVTDPATPVITPPDSWSAEYRAKFAALPLDLQAVIVEREREQKSAFNKQINEVAETKKAAETERQRLAQTLDHFITNATSFDPILAEGQRTDWAKLAREDPVAYVEKKAAFDQRVGELRMAQAERQNLEAHNIHETRMREANALLEKVPEWKDPEKYKAEWSAMKDTGKKLYGFSEQELESFNDHRFVIALRNLHRYDQMVKAQQTVQTKKVVPVQKIQKPGGGEASAKGGAKALKQAVANASGMHEKAALVASMIED